MQYATRYLLLLLASVYNTVWNTTRCHWILAGTGQQYKYGVGKMVFLHLHLLHKQGWLSYTCDGHGLLPHCLHTLHVPRLGNQAYAIHILLCRQKKLVYANQAYVIHTLFVHQTCQLSSHQAYIVCTPSMSSNLIVPTNQTIQWQEIPWDLLLKVSLPPHHHHHHHHHHHINIMMMLNSYQVHVYIIGKL